jgi:hypothetical protein
MTKAGHQCEPTDVRAQIEGGWRGAMGWLGVSRVCVRRRSVMQALFASIVGSVAEMGVFFVAAAALTAGALALR